MNDDLIYKSGLLYVINYSVLSRLHLYLIMTLSHEVCDNHCSRTTLTLNRMYQHALRIIQGLLNECKCLICYLLTSIQNNLTIVVEPVIS